MTLSDIDAVRLKTSDRSTITRESSVGDGETIYYKLSHANVLTSPDIQIFADDVPVVSGFAVDYRNGIVTFLGPHSIGVNVDFVYYWSIFSDEEVEYFLSEGGGNVTIASARLLLAIAADAAKVAQRESMAGGGGLGSVSIDTSVAARELRNTAQALLQMEKDISTSVPAEGITEPAWTEFGVRDSLEQHLIRES